MKAGATWEAIARKPEKHGRKPQAGPKNHEKFTLSLKFATAGQKHSEKNHEKALDAIKTACNAPKDYDS